MLRKLPNGEKEIISTHIWRPVGEVVRQGWISGGFESLELNLEISFCFVLILTNVTTTGIWHFLDISVRLNASGAEDRTGKDA